MSKVITDKKLIEEVLTRGVEKIYPSYELLEKELLSGRRLKLYCGFDPTAPSLHIGNAISLNKLGQFQALGHEVIFLIGDFTGLIGDPTDKKAVRRQLTKEEVEHNARDYKKQASAYLRFDGDNPAKIKYNSEWNSKLTFADLIELASNFTVQRMIQRDMFQKRLAKEKPIYLHEFLYPLTQAYDSLAMNVDLEVGGNDQMFNMMCGRDLLKIKKGKEKFVLTMKLLTDDQGQKMGKSDGNVVFLNEKPENMYGQIMSWPDGVLGAAFELTTKLPWKEVKNIKQELKQAKVNPRDLKMKLAKEITRINYGSNLAQEAEDNFIKTIQKKEIPTEIPNWLASKKSYLLIDLLVESKLASSRTEARRLIEQGAIKEQSIKGPKVLKDPKQEIKIKSGLILSRGKLHFIKIITKNNK